LFFSLAKQHVTVLCIANIRVGDGRGVGLLDMWGAMRFGFVIQRGHGMIGTFASEKRAQPRAMKRSLAIAMISPFCLPALPVFGPVMCECEVGLCLS
jgi:hypothetical protein